MKQESLNLLEKSQRALRAAETLFRGGDYEAATGRAYYAMLHAAQALLRARDLRYRKHGSVHAGFAEHFTRTGRFDIKYHRWLLDAFDDRLRADYDIEVSFDRDSVAARIEQAREFLETARRYLENEP
jgi:uncharacterized protein (UPF0332 family)